MVQHRGAEADGYLARHLDERCELPVREAEDKEPARPGG
ncbi:MAG: chemotaxis protein CheB [Desulfurivibrio sp.]|nr:chemotaxis protein CheB [Desulfurivibrio sp.]